MRWAGHVARMPDARLPKIALDNQLAGNRPPGRPRKRWEDCVKESVIERGEDPRSWKNVAQDRLRWRRMSAAAMGPNVARPPPTVGWGKSEHK